MAETRDKSVVIPLEFLGHLKPDEQWVSTELEGKGLGGKFKIKDGILVSSNLEVIRYVNRIRAFSYLNQTRILAYFDLQLKDRGGNTTRCITSHPREILPQLSALGFREESFLVPNVGAPELDACRVSDPIEGEFAQMDRDTFRTRYFGPVGELKMSEYERFNGDPTFIARALDLGFFAYVGSYTGYLQIELDEAR